MKFGCRAASALLIAALLATGCSARDIVYVGELLASDASVSDGSSEADGGFAGAPVDDAGISDVGDSAITRMAPPGTWQEHWRGHGETLTLVDYNDDVALYFDTDVDQSAYSFLFPFLTSMWNYVLATYGGMGDDRLYVVVHGQKHPGAHHGLYFEEAHEFKNVLDIGGIVPENEYSRTLFVTHEASHIVEFAAFGKRGSPAFVHWGDSKWAEFFQYDLYTALSMSEVSSRGYQEWTAKSDDFPQAGTHWFRDWFYPLWRDHGGARVMRDYFELLARYFPAQDATYTRDLTFGEYVHFMSGAAKLELKPLATSAFGWTDAWEREYRSAQATFTQFTY